MLRTTVSSLQQREADALRQVQQSVEVAEQAQLERVQVSNFNYKSTSLSQFEKLNLKCKHSATLFRWRTKFDV